MSEKLNKPLRKILLISFIGFAKKEIKNEDTPFSRIIFRCLLNLFKLKIYKPYFKQTKEQ